MGRIATLRQECWQEPGCCCVRQARWRQGGRSEGGGAVATKAVCYRKEGCYGALGEGYLKTLAVVFSDAVI